MKASRKHLSAKALVALALAAPVGIVAASPPVAAASATGASCRTDSGLSIRDGWGYDHWETDPKTGKQVWVHYICDNGTLRRL
jgi:hypothetical protein